MNYDSESSLTDECSDNGLEADEEMPSEEADDEDDGIELGGTVGISNQEKRDEEQYHYEVYTLDTVKVYMNDIVKQITAIIELPDSVTRLLLNHFKWDREKLMEAFYDACDTSQLFKKAGIAIYDGTLAGASSMVPVTTMGLLECRICADAYSSDAMLSLKCGHPFCKPCWRSYLKSKIIDEGVGQGIVCAAYKCNLIVDDDTILQLLQDDTVIKQKYQYLTLKTFVESNRVFRWCPAPNCAYVIKVQHYDAKPVKCACGITFCFSCRNEWHAPVVCVKLSKWLKKCSEDSDTSNWIAANTKECPKCRAVIHKDGGCNHMTCKSVSCKAEFCWVCLGPWEPHGTSWYACNRYNDGAAMAARDAQQRSRAELQRYVHYYNRYANHMLSLSLEHKLYATVKNKMEEIQNSNMSWVEVQFLRKAVDVLCDCRRTLKYTYVFAYYLKKNNQTIIFENNQQDLELSTEKLSEILERDLVDTDLTLLKQTVQDKYRYCENRRKALLNHCNEGDEKGWWEYRD